MISVNYLFNLLEIVFETDGVDPSKPSNKEYLSSLGSAKT